MLRKPNVRPVRRGIASLELVLVFPFLLSLVAGLFVIAWADVVKVGTTTAARNQAWQQRPQTTVGQPLGWQPKPLDGQINTGATNNVPLGPLYRGQVLQANSRNSLIANTWSNPTISFSSVGQTIKPHASVIDDILPGVGDTIAASLIPFNPSTCFVLYPYIPEAVVLGGLATAAGWTLDNIDGNIMRGAEIPIAAALAAAEASVVGCLFGACEPLEIGLAFLDFAINDFHNLNLAAQGKPGDPSVLQFKGLDQLLRSFGLTP